jgi:hypothetical protein
MTTITMRGAATARIKRKKGRRSIIIKYTPR